MNDLVRCKKCGKVFLAVSLDFATHEVEKFNSYFDTLTDEQKKEYYGNNKSSLEDYTICFYCGNSYVDFAEFNNEVNINGCTINPILHFDEVVTEGVNEGVSEVADD